MHIQYKVYAKSECVQDLALTKLSPKTEGRGEDVGKGFGKGKPKKRGSPSAFGGFYYPSPLLRFALCKKAD